MQHALDALPGYRRRLRVTPTANQVRSELEDDFHCMTVTVHHDGAIATAIEAATPRAPWTTCPEAIERVKETFTGVALKDFAVRGEKRTNCTHLHDLAVLAGAHALDAEPLVYDILVCDPIAGERRAELRRNGASVLSWTERQGRITEPAAIAGLGALELGPWIDSLEPQQREAARLLRWATLVAHGRTIPLDQQSDAAHMPAGVCYTFQPKVAARATRVGDIRDFSRGTAQPLDSLDGGSQQRGRLPTARTFLITSNPLIRAIWPEEAL